MFYICHINIALMSRRRRRRFEFNVQLKMLKLLPIRECVWFFNLNSFPYHCRHWKLLDFFPPAIHIATSEMENVENFFPLSVSRLVEVKSQVLAVSSSEKRQKSIKLQTTEIDSWRQFWVAVKRKKSVAFLGRVRGIRGGECWCVEGNRRRNRKVFILCWTCNFR